MAEPAFIYAFDNLGPEHFTQLCGRLLASRHKGFVLGGVGADGGVDAEVDNTFGTWYSEIKDALGNEIIQPGQTVIFQFKHIVTGRAGGQTKAREHLLSMYNCRKGYVCEIHRGLIVNKKLDCYVLVTNVEVNSNFRTKYVEQCRSHNPEIGHYQVIGLDELEVWVTSEVSLRHLYFPTIFGPPQFNLRIQVSEGVGVPLPFKSHYDRSIPLFLVRVMNVGVVPSYISTISFRSIVDGEEQNLFVLNLENEFLKQINPEPGAVVQPGRGLDYRFTFDILHGLKNLGTEVFPFEVRVYDEIGNIYGTKIPEDLIRKILE